MNHALTNQDHDILPPAQGQATSPVYFVFVECLIGRGHKTQQNTKVKIVKLREFAHVGQLAWGMW